MRKVKLDLDELRVESFAAGFPEPVAKGTVQAHATQPNQATCWNTCPYTCSHEIACFNTT